MLSSFMLYKWFTLVMEGVSILLEFTLFCMVFGKENRWCVVNMLEHYRLIKSSKALDVRDFS